MHWSGFGGKYRKLEGLLCAEGTVSRYNGTELVSGEAVEINV
jgi:hypothetical protein